MFSTIPCSVSPLKFDISKRRSKSLDDLVAKKKDKDPLNCYKNNRSPVIAFDTSNPIPIRRHSVDSKNKKEYSRLATIYGWVTTEPIISLSEKNDHRKLQTSRSFSHLPTHNNKFRGILSRKTLNTTLKKKIQHPSFHDDSTIVSSILLAAPEIEDSSLVWLNPLPPPPIENNPHVFDLLKKDSSQFIHFAKADNSFTSATVEKLVEKLTREMDYEFLMDFFLTFREFLTPIKLCKLLILRFRWALLEESDERRLVRIRTFVVIRHWLTHYWSFDFMQSRTLRFMLSTFLTQLQTHPAIMSSPRDERIIKSLRHIFKRQRKSKPQDPVQLYPDPIEPRSDWRSKVRDSIKKSIQPDFEPNSIVLRYRSEMIAQQFALIEQAMLQDITWDELVELRWRKRSKESNEMGVDKLIAFFNKSCQWVASEIVRTRVLEVRVKMIEKFIRIALKCYHHRNYSTLMQIILGLQSPAVSRLEKTWQKVDYQLFHLFDQLKDLAKPFRNWKNIREYMMKATEDIAESFAVESILTKSYIQPNHDQGCIPFLGLYLSDLVFVAELPNFIESYYSDTSGDEEEEEDKELCERLRSRLVNYNKFRITASVVKHVLAFQMLSRAYKFKHQKNLYTQLQSMTVLDNAQIRTASLLCE